VQFVRSDQAGIAAVRETVETLAELEGLPLHAEAVAVRA
jgi:histidinol dehydrogenase